MLNPIGVFLQHLRTDHSEKWLDVAKKIDTNPPYLSNVCNGQKRCPDHWAELITNRYELSEEKRRELIGAIALSNHDIRLVYEQLNDDDKDLVFTLANFVDTMHPKQKEKIREVINKGWV